MKLGSHTVAGEPQPLVIDSQFAGWAMGGENAVRSRRFTKPAMEMRSLGHWADPWATLSERPWRPD